MSNRWFVLGLLATLLVTACEEENLDSDIANQLDQSEQAVMHGTVSTNEPAVVGLYVIKSCNKETQTCDSYITCTGTLIHPNWVLTAAHCVTYIENGNIIPIHPTYFSIYYGHDKLSTPISYNDIFNNMQYITDIYTHENYTLTEHPNGSVSDVRNDIALLKLDKPFSTSPQRHIDPIPPLPKWLALNALDLPQAMKVVGFGYDETGSSGIKHERVVMCDQYCGFANPNDQESGCYAGMYFSQGCHPNNEYCQEYGEQDTYGFHKLEYGNLLFSAQGGVTCNGDSGGPAIITKANKRFVAGVFSLVDGACSSYAVHTATQDFYDWIISKAPEIAEQYKEICDNGIDDDGNGLIDELDNACFSCGDGKINAGEVCDHGEKLDLLPDDADTCEKVIGKGSIGTVKCAPDCKSIITIECTESAYCGDGKINGTEVCDGNVFASHKTTCAQWDSSKYDAGNVICTDTCQIDYSGCRLAPAPEICDNKIDDNNNGLTDCYDPDCAAHTSCKSVCGNGIVEGKEQCDGTAIANDMLNCSDWYDFFKSGTVSCYENCELNFDQCLTTFPNESDDGCSANPYKTSSVPFALLGMALTGFALLLRRRKTTD